MYAAALDEEAAPADRAALPACRVMLDIGHLRTNVCVLQGNEAVTARTILRGGAALTTAIAQAYRCDEAMAEDIKLSSAMVASAAHPATTADELRMDAALKEALVPLLRDVRQTMASVRARLRVPVESVLLTGGTARLPGLADYLAEELEVPVQLWTGRRPEAVPHVEEEDPTDAAADPVGVDTRFALCTPPPGRARAATSRSTCAAGRSSTRPACRSCGRRRPTWARWRRPSSSASPSTPPWPWAGCATSARCCRAS